MDIFLQCEILNTIVDTDKEYLNSCAAAMVLRSILIETRCTRGVRVVFSVTRMRVHMTVFEIVAGHNVVNWMQLLT